MGEILAFRRSYTADELSPDYERHMRYRQLHSNSTSYKAESYLGHNEVNLTIMTADAH